MATALVTGGTAGIGATFARHLAARGDDLVLVARDTERLNRSAAELSAAYGVTVEVLTADLNNREQTERVVQRVLDAEHPIDLVVNNAGFGLHSSMVEDSTAPDEQALNVMCRAVLLLSNAAARAMKSRGNGRIINIASTAAFITQGHYSALKSWVLVYTESLALQLRGTGVTATALCPGWVRTEFHDRAGINASSIPDIAWIDADRLVRECLVDADRGRIISIPTRLWRTAIIAARHAPRSTIYWFSRKLTSSRKK
ncbi:SDR family NAD(P)-dependent oxidoreductase [Granulicoccus phenolivorans]|uniref:SDR family NAD(P)-dependent oxidoreductase n=1 Tax=Granulicoccus phenolivorans TaxID=266854 RepID=UPI000413F029|nr:SDR family NAD(P)-dependent oxidoreductase [Granulicoccus phenolivorans]